MACQCSVKIFVHAKTVYPNLIANEVKGRNMGKEMLNEGEGERVGR